MPKGTYIKMIIMFALAYTTCIAAKSSYYLIDSLPSRVLRYFPDGNDFVIVNGKNKFNRSLYGQQTAFRIEAGDLPLIALYLPGTGGCLKFGIINHHVSKWAETFSYIESRYHNGKIVYSLGDSSIGTTKIQIEAIPLHITHGIGVKIQIRHVTHLFQFILAFGGAGGLHPPRNGDLGADSPDVFDLTSAHCQNNLFLIHPPYFSLTFKNRDTFSTIEGIFPLATIMKISDAASLANPEALIHSLPNKKNPVLTGSISISHDTLFYLIIKEKDNNKLPIADKVKQLFNNADEYLNKIANRVQIHTPDPFMNTIGGAISIAANALWQNPVFMHGAVAWRMPYNGWRGAYAANDLGWHNRARIFFEAYNKSQLTKPDTTIIAPDPKANMSRQIEKIGMGIYNSGYICRYPDGKLVPGHYDMNLVYFDAMLRYFQWTGDTNFMRECWPIIKRHLEWEKRNFDQDGDYLFDAYACIWASDALEYSGGDVTYSSAYNYFENKLAARIASILHENPLPFEKEAKNIRKAMFEKLWIPKNGWFGEYRDLIGSKNLHPDAGLWTVYHTIDEEVTDAFQNYQLLQYVDYHIPHQYFKCKNIPGRFFELSTTDWMPYTWSVNNVVMAEMAHAALAYWEGGRKNTAYQLWKSLILESMYLGNCPGNFEQLSSLDHFRGELYRDFGDAIGVCARTLVEGLFGIRPNAITGSLYIIPGWPNKWKFAEIKTPNILMKFHEEKNIDKYVIIPSFQERMNLKMEIPFNNKYPEKIEINHIPVKWEIDSQAIQDPKIKLSFPYQDKYKINIKWEKIPFPKIIYRESISSSELLQVSITDGRIIRIYDPQEILEKYEKKNSQILNCKLKNSVLSHHTFFVQIEYHNLVWWIPININIQNPIGIQILNKGSATLLQLTIRDKNIVNSKVNININSAYTLKNLILFDSRICIKIPNDIWFTGTNQIVITKKNKKLIDTTWVDWAQHSELKYQFETIPLNDIYNAKIQNIFKVKYLSPRPKSPTLQIPTQGIGNWTCPNVMPEISVNGLLQKTDQEGKFNFPGNIPFYVQKDSTKNNIAFVSLWSNYPDSIIIPVQANAYHAYFLMAGTTNYMQTRIPNGKIIVVYDDNTRDSLLLINPDTWWPIEQDYYIDHFAFPDYTPRPYRITLKTGEIIKFSKNYSTIPGFTNMGIEGGAATLLDIPLDHNKKIAYFILRASANEVVLGLMGLTLVNKSS